MYAFAANDAFLERQEVEHERCRITDLSHAAGSGEPVPPRSGGRFAKRRMDLVVVGAKHIQGEDALELAQREDRLVLGGVVTPRPHIR